MFSKSVTAAVIALLPLIVPLVAAEDPDKWVWSSDGDVGGERRVGTARYEVFENEGGFERPGRPTFGAQGAGLLNRPYKPGQGLYGPQRPGGIYGDGSFRPPRPSGGNYGEGNFGLGGSGSGGPVLTGPSYGKERPFKYFDSCKCTERFNCNSYGVAYGHCDVGKQYCCHSKKSGPPPSRPIHSGENGVLVGPGGPHDRPSIDRNPYDGNNGILVGPGGPTGVIRGPSRPNGNHPGNGVLIGPGGPFDSPYNNIGSLYARSTKEK